MRKLSWMALLPILLHGCNPSPSTESPRRTSSFSLVEARKNHQTRLLTTGPAPQEYKKQAPAGVQVVEYEAAGRKLMAWLAKPAGDGPFPAVLYVHGGFALEAEDYQAIEPLVRAGYLVLLPSFRGENGNPGYFEMCYGEADDAVAALRYLQAQTNVDAQRVFLLGHSSVNGGTLALLVAEMATGLRSALIASALPDFRGIVEASNQPPYQHVQTPFDWRDPVETDLRSPSRHLRSLQCPTLLLYGDREYEPIQEQAREAGAEAKRLQKPLTVEALRSEDASGTVILDPDAAHRETRRLAVLRAIEWFPSHDKEARPSQAQR